jgi:acyl transferase domain-containing protein
MYESGARIFIEVGPRNILSSLVAEILKDRGDTIIVALDPQRGALRGFLNALGRLYVEGLPIDLKAIFAARQESDLSAAHSPPRNRDWLLSGGGVRKPHESAGLSGKNPLLTFASLSEQTHPTPAAPSRLNNQQTEIMTNPKEPLSEPPRPQNGGGAGNRPYETALQAYADYQETMRQFLKVQEEVMKQFLARETSGVAPATSIKEIDTAPARFQPAPAQNGSSLSMPPVVNGSSESRKEPVETAVPDAGAAPYDREDLTKILLDLVSERTGYPPEMLGLDQDLEADLGIDSIKRVEIVGAFQNQLPPIFVQKLTLENHDLSRVRTLNGWVDILVAPTDVTPSR